MAAIKQGADGDDSGTDDKAQMSIEARCVQLEEENRRLKLLVADLTLRNEALKLVAWKKW